MPIVWSPAGQFIAGWWKDSNINKIIFFEKNCLIHGEIILDEDI